MGLDGEGTSADDLWDVGSREAIAEHVRELADAKLEARAAEVGEADWSMVERLVLIRTIDSLWVEHLTELDDMRRGIGLRGYAQQDPLNEFRREAFALYEELRDLIRHGVATSIFRVTVTRQPTPSTDGADPAVGAALARGAAALSSGNGSNGRGPGGGVGVGAGARTAGPLELVRGQERALQQRPCRPGRLSAATARRRSAGRRSFAAVRPRCLPTASCESRSAISRSSAARSVPERVAPRRVAPGQAIRRPATGSAATIRAGADPAPSTRSATAGSAD